MNSAIITDKWTAIVPLRSGSKGLPGKNTRILIEKPLYHYSIDAAINAGASRVVITTNIPKVINETYHDSVTVLERPEFLCGDTAQMESVLFHAINEAKIEGDIALLQATSPLREAGDVLSALTLLRTKNFDLVMTVTEADASVLKYGQIGENGIYHPLGTASQCFSNRQSLPKIYKPNGAVYAMRSEWFMSNNGFETENLGTVVMPLDRSVDIDTLEDFEKCENYMKQMS